MSTQLDLLRTMPAPLAVLGFEAKNVLGIKHLAIQPGRVTVIRGRNGAGKTSAIEAMRAAIGGGNLANLARVENGVAQDPEIVLLLGEPGQPERLRVTKTAKGIKVKERVENSAAFQDVRSPQAFIDALSDGRSSNPVAFLTARDRELVSLVLEAIPLRMDRAAFDEIVGDAAPLIAGRSSLQALHPLEEIGATAEAIFNARTGVNRDAKNAAAAADRLRRSTPALILGAETRQQRDALTFRAAELRDVLAGDRARISADMASDIRAAEAEREAAKERAGAVYRAAMAAADQAFEKAKADATNTAADERANLAEEQSELDALEAKVAELGRAIEQAARDQALADEAAKEERRAAAYQAQADKLTATLSALEAFRATLAENLPIRGLEIRDGGIYLDGVPHHQANTARRVEMAVDVALARSAGTRLRLILVDGMEALDSETFEALADRLQAIPDAQIILGRVADRPLDITADGRQAGRLELGKAAKA